MFAPPLKAPKAKAGSQATPTRSPKPPQHMPLRPGLGIAEQILTLQRTIGNQAVLRLLSPRAEGLTGSTFIGHQTQEADRERIFGTGAAPSASCSTAPRQIRRKCAACEEEEAKTLQTKPAGTPKAA